MWCARVAATPVRGGRALRGPIFKFFDKLGHLELFFGAFLVPNPKTPGVASNLDLA